VPPHKGFEILLHKYGVKVMAERERSVKGRIRVDET
jgi:hypothetical protein